MMAMKCRPRIRPRSSCSFMMRAMPTGLLKSADCRPRMTSNKLCMVCTVMNIGPTILWRAESAIEWRCGVFADSISMPMRQFCRRSPG